MAWVRHARGAERLPHILASHSLNEEALRAHLALYRAIMFGPSELTRSEREAMAVAVSSVNECHYWRVHHGDALTRESGDPSLAEAVASGAWDRLPDRMRRLCEYARALTEQPAAVTEAALDPLREAGLDDRAIVDANQVVAYFNYVNRIAEGLGVGLEEHWGENPAG